MFQKRKAKRYTGIIKKSLKTWYPFLLPVVTLLAVSVGTASGDNGWMSDFNSTYGTSGTPLGSCSVCHTDTFDFNTYGADLISNDGSLTAIELLDSDGDGATNIAEIEALTFPGSASSKPPASPPVANAGPDQTVDPGVVLITLDGTNSSDPDNDIDMYLWTQQEGPTVILYNPDSPQPSFDAPAAVPGGVSLIFELQVTDSGGRSSTDKVAINITFLNKPPTADAGPDQPEVAGGTLVTLNGSNSSDPDTGDQIQSYQWAQTGGPTVTLSNPAAAQPTFTTPNGGTTGLSLTFELTVSDIEGLTDTDSVMVSVAAEDASNIGPTADAGVDQDADEGAEVTLDGSNSSDPDDGIQSFLWTQTEGTAVTLSDPAAMQPTFQVPDVGTKGEALTFQLTVTDFGGLSATDTTDVNVSSINASPTANAGADQTADPGDTVTLDGSGSSDPDDGIQSYQWIQTEGPSVTLADPTAMQTSFLAPDGGTEGKILIFELRVTDAGELAATDDTVVQISGTEPSPPPNDPGPTGGGIEDSLGSLVNDTNELARSDTLSSRTRRNLLAAIGNMERAAALLDEGKTHEFLQELDRAYLNLVRNSGSDDDGEHRRRRRTAETGDEAIQDLMARIPGIAAAEAEAMVQEVANALGEGDKLVSRALKYLERGMARLENGQVHDGMEALIRAAIYAEKAFEQQTPEPDENSGNPGDAEDNDREDDDDGDRTSNRMFREQFRRLVTE